MTTICRHCNKHPLSKRLTHQHTPLVFMSPSEGRPGLWHTVHWDAEWGRWVCDSQCKGGYGKGCHHISEVEAILRDEHAGWLGEVPRLAEAPINVTSKRPTLTLRERFSESDFVDNFPSAWGPTYHTPFDEFGDDDGEADLEVPMPQPVTPKKATLTLEGIFDRQDL